MSGEARHVGGYRMHVVVAGGCVGLEVFDERERVVDAHACDAEEARELAAMLRAAAEVLEGELPART